MMMDRTRLERAMDGTAAITRGLTRRTVLCAALPTLALGPVSARGADSRVPIADMHSHFGIITRPTLSSTDFAEELRARRVADLGAFHAQGLRHVQFVHFVRNPIGDFQTVAPVHNGLSEAGKRLVEACNAQGILVDLAHCSWPAVEQALEVASKPLIWSHGWVDQAEGRWQDSAGYLQRRLSLPQAKRIADRGVVVGLWGLAVDKPGPSRTPGQGNWTVGRGDVRAYAREIANLVNWLGADHVGIGTDIEGVGTSWSVNGYAHVRGVVDALQDLKLPATAVERVAGGNYARVLGAALGP